MGRSLVTAQVPILGSIFANSNSPNRLIQGDGTVYIAKVSQYGGVGGLVNSIEFPKAAAGLSSAYKAYGVFSPNISIGGSVSVQSSYSRAFTYGMHLAKSATIYQSNKTENYYANGVDYPNVSIVGQMRIGFASLGVEVPLTALAYSGNEITADLSPPSRSVYGHYYDTVNSRDVWLCLASNAGSSLRISTADGVNFTTTTVTGISNTRYHQNIGAFKPVIFMNGANGVLITRIGSTPYEGTDEAVIWQTTNNFSSASNISGNWYTAGTGNGYPVLFNYDGTTLFLLLGNGSSTTVNPKYSTNLGTTVAASTVSGDTATMRGCYGGGSFQGNNGAGLCHATGSNASEFMYISYDQGNNTAYSYYTSNGGQTFTSKSLQSILDAVTNTNNSYDGFLSLNYNGGRWVALFQKTGLGIYAITSTNNGTTWSSASKVFEWDSSYYTYGYDYLVRVFSHNGTFVAVKSGGYSYTATKFAKSTDGVTWTKIIDPYANQGEGIGFIELTNSFIVLGRVIDKTSFTITGITGQTMATQSYYMHYMPARTAKFASAYYNSGAAVVSDTSISSNIFTTSVGAYYNSYATSGSVYGAYEYVRVK